jgi:hypothetical protein
MRLTWKDAVSTTVMALIVAIYVAFLADAGWPLVAGARGTATAILVLGIVGGCALSSAAELYGKAVRPATRVLAVVANLIGVLALVAAVYALVTANVVAVGVLFAATAALWLLATLRHAFGRPAAAVGGRDVHEVIDPHRVSR